MELGTFIVTSSDFDMTVLTNSLFLVLKSSSLTDLLSQDEDGIYTEICETFAQPISLKNGVERVRERILGVDFDILLRSTMKLIEHSVLVSYDAYTEDESSQRGMFGCPMLSVDEAVLGDICDVAFVGMPYDLGVTGREGTRSGPSYLRRSSRIAFDYSTDSGYPRGWWSSDQNKRLLEGVRFVDTGDVSCRGEGRNGSSFDELYDCVSELHAANRLPIIIGGDHSISYASISATAHKYPRVGIIQFDAHPDLGRSASTSKWRRNMTHGNFLSWVEPMQEVEVIVQLGIRHLLPDPPFVSNKVSAYPGTDWVPNIEDIVKGLPTDIVYYLTFDVDCMDPTVISQTGTPIPGGINYEQARYAFQVIGRHLDIVGVDVVELMPPRADNDNREGVTIAYLLFALIAEIFDRKNTGLRCMM